MDNDTIDDFAIQALVDQQLDWESEKRVRAYMQMNPVARKRYDELCRQRDMLRSWWQQSGQH